MSAASDSRRVQRSLPVAAGLSLIVGTFVVNTLLDGPGTSALCGGALVLGGCLLIVSGIFAPPGRYARLIAKTALAVLSVIITMTAAELVFRGIGYDFDLPGPNVPICACRPNFHDGGGILRRRGPAVWRGKPLSWLVQNYPSTAKAYSNEKPIEGRYDRFGFRNPPGLADWEVVVAGDSFVEAGYLAVQDMFTSIAANELGVRIKNLGVSGTGPVFQTAYVQRYGKAPSTKNAVLCFFDGNDVSDLCREISLTNCFFRTGQCLGLKPQHSLFVALQDRWRGLTQSGAQVGYESAPNAVLTISNREIPLVLLARSANWEDLTNDRQSLVTAALTNWGHVVRSLGMEPWVMSIPERQRVLDGYLRYANTNSVLARSRPRPFGPALSNICAQAGIRFVDTWPALRREMELGRVPYNLYGDAHLNADGSRAVGHALAEALRSHLKLAAPGEQL